jgi:hypothetical protein
MVRDAAGQFLFVIDNGSSPTPGYPIANSPYASCPHVPTAANDVCPSISVFTMTSGTLTLAAGSPFYLSKIPSALSAITFTPSSGTAEELLFVTNKQDICSQGCIAPSPHNDNTVSVYSVNSSGALAEQIPNSPYAVAAVNPISVLAVNTNPAGQNSGGVFVYVGNEDANGGHLYPFEVCTTADTSNCTQQNLMFPLRTCPDPSCDIPPSTAGQSPIAMVVDRTNKFLYAVAQGSSQVFGFTINTGSGKLTALSPNPNLPTGSHPVSMALHSTVNNTGQFLFTSNSGSTNITGFTLSTTSGVMNSLPSPTSTTTTPSGMTAR